MPGFMPEIHQTASLKIESNQLPGNVSLVIVSGTGKRIEQFIPGALGIEVKRLRQRLETDLVCRPLADVHRQRTTGRILAPVVLCKHIRADHQQEPARQDRQCFHGTHYDPRVSPRQGVATTGIP